MYTQFYLKAFQDPTRPDHVWVYEKGSSDKKLLPIKRIAKIYDYYTFRDENGQVRDEIERLLSDIEGKASPILKRWVDSPTLGCLDVEKDVMTAFLALFHCRSPRSRQDTAAMSAIITEEELKRRLNNPKFIEKFLASPESQGMTREDLDELRQMVVEGGHFHYVTVDKYSMGMSLLLFKELAKRLVRMSWGLLKAPSDCILLTADSPFSVCDVRPNGQALLGVGIGLPGVQATLPISPEIAVRLSWGRESALRCIDAAEVGEINRRVVAQADRFVFASQLRTGITRLTDEFRDSMKTRISPDRVRAIMDRVRRTGESDT